MLRIGLLICLMMFGTALAQQQIFTEREGVELVNAYADDEIIVSIPEDWLVFRRADYATLNAAISAQQRIFNRIDRNLEAIPGLVELITLSATRPQLAATFPIQMYMIVFPLEQMAAEVGVDPGDLVPEQVAQMLNFSQNSLDVNGRRVSVGYQYAELVSLGAVYLFAEQEKVVVINFPATDAYLSELEPMIAAVVLSVRLEGEVLDIEAVETFLDNDEPLPDFIALPGTEPEVTPEATLDPESTAEVTPEVEPACTVSAFGNVNLRERPGTNYQILGSLPAGATAEAVAQAEGADGLLWWRIGDEGWARADGVEEFGECDALPEVNIAE